jgi:hypothetical protein
MPNHKANNAAFTSVVGGTILASEMLGEMKSRTGTRTMVKAALLGMGIVAAVATTATAQNYIPSTIQV